MTRQPQNPHFLLVTTLVSVMAAWIGTSIAFAPFPQDHSAAPAPSTSSSSRPLFHISPVPPGADWTA